MEFSNIELYTLKEIRDLWINETKDYELKINIDQYLKDEAFFLDSERLDQFFYIGIDNKEYKHILISKITLLKVKNELEAKFHFKLPEFPNCKEYYKIKKIKFKNSQNYKNLILNIKANHHKLNKRVKQRSQIEGEYELAKDLIKQVNQLNEIEKPFFIAIDIESYYLDHKIILEIGWSIFDSTNQQFCDRHIIIKDYHHLRNNKIGMDCKDRFLFGNSIEMKEADALKVLQSDLNTFSKNLIVVCHALENELQYFKRMGIKPRFKYAFDTCKFNMVIYNEKQNISLGRLLDKLNIDGFCLHNAGNDAHYTLLAFLKMCEYNPIN